MSPQRPVELIDIGANLTSKSFEGDRDEVIRRAHESGVRTIVVTGTSIEGSELAAELARERMPALYATAGVHPHDAKSFTDNTAAKLEALAANPAVRALGECGLDYNRNFSPRDAQLRAFEAQL